MLVIERDGTIWVAQPGAATSTRAVAPTAERPDRLRARPARHRARPASRRTAGSTSTTPTGRSCATTSRASPRPATASLSTEPLIWRNASTPTSGTRAATSCSGRRHALHLRRRPSRRDHRSTADARNGKILRINRRRHHPADNPFYDGYGPDMDAIWARGLRNPFRFTIDPPTGRITSPTWARTAGRRSTSASAGRTTAGRPARGPAPRPG